MHFDDVAIIFNNLEPRAGVLYFQGVQCARALVDDI